MSSRRDWHWGLGGGPEGRLVGSECLVDVIGIFRDWEGGA